MASTYTPIASTTTSNNTTTQVSFGSISGYTDLVVVQSLPDDPNGTYGYSNMRFNSDTGTSYSSTYYYYYNGVTSGRQNNVTGFLLSGTSSYMGNASVITSILNYSNTTTYKSILNRANVNQNGGGAAAETFVSVGTWRSTSAITSVQIFTGTGFSTGSTFTIYGILAA
jgi:hypothetical protein